MFVVRAEASLLIGDIDSMRKFYSQSNIENQALSAEYKKRHLNHTELLEKLKQLNMLIKHASSLRIYVARSANSKKSQKAAKKIGQLRPTPTEVPVSRKPGQDPSEQAIQLARYARPAGQTQQVPVP